MRNRHKFRTEPRETPSRAVLEKARKQKSEKGSGRVGEMAETEKEAVERAFYQEVWDRTIAVNLKGVYL